MLVAVTVIDVPESGAVTTPAGVTLPAEADQVTADDGLPVPTAVAVQVTDFPNGRVETGQETLRLLMVAT